MSTFPSTQPMEASDPRGLAPAWPAQAARPARPRSQPVEGGSTELSSLSPSLLQDLMRFDQGQGERRELLEVLAACVRHTQPLAIRLDTGSQAAMLAIYPLQRLAHCTVPLDDLLARHLHRLQVLQVQPARERLPVDAGLTGIRLAADASGSEASRSGTVPLAPVLWAVALYGSRSALLPELAGQAAYRVAPGVSLGALGMPAAMATVITRLRRHTCNLREIAEWNGIGRERAQRLLNALYLQSALIVSRSHPAATNEGWDGYR
ncbi:MAG: hypothetical protein KBC73_01785 [Burkholderiaceae bacterium]|nr:hypothetical protein [Burkholderiaceae bacterium]